MATQLRPKHITATGVVFNVQAAIRGVLVDGGTLTLRDGGDNGTIIFVGTGPLYVKFSEDDLPALNFKAATTPPEYLHATLTAGTATIYTK